MATSLSQEFYETAAAAHEAFPKQLKKLVLLLLPAADTPVYASPEIADQLTESAAAIKKVVKEKADMFQKLGAAGQASRNYDLAGTRVDMISLMDAEHLRGGYFTRQFTKEMRVIYNLDHEIGHHILKNGYPSYKVSGQLAESAADAYATLRHIQRFGKHTDHAGGHGESRAFFIVLNPNIEHYTTDVIQRVFQLSEETDFSKLSLHETAALAEKITDECRIDEETLERIAMAYQPAQDAVEKQIGSVPDILAKLYGEDKEAYALFCCETVAVMKKYRNNPDIFKAGKQFLNYPLIKKFMIEAAETDSCYREMLSFIDNPKAKMFRKSPLRGLFRSR